MPELTKISSDIDDKMTGQLHAVCNHQPHVIRMTRTAHLLHRLHHMAPAWPTTYSRFPLTMCDAPRKVVGCPYSVALVTGLTAVVTYSGHVLTLSDEVDLVWRRPPGGTTSASSRSSFSIATLPSSANEFPILLSGVTGQPPFMVRVVLQLT